MIVIPIVFVLMSLRSLVRAEIIAERFRETFGEGGLASGTRWLRPILWTVGSPLRIRVFAIAGIALFGLSLVADLR